MSLTAKRYKLVLVNRVTGEERPSTAMRNSGPMSAREANALVKQSMKIAVRTQTDWAYKKVLITGGSSG